METKQVKCKYCDRLLGHRQNNEFTPVGGSPQFHCRTFYFQCKDMYCPFADEWQMFAVNQKDVPKFEFKNVLNLKMETA